MRYHARAHDIAGILPRDAARELPVISPDEEVLYGETELRDDIRRHEERDEGRKRAGLQLGGEILDCVMQRVPLAITILPVQALARDEELTQGVRVRHAVVVHDPNVVVPKLDGLSHAIVEPTGAAEVLARIEIGDLPGLSEGGQRLLGTIRARVVNDDDGKAVAFAKGTKVLLAKAIEALEQQVLAVICHDDGGDALAILGISADGGH